MKSVKVSVIVPNYNHEKFLPARLDSVFNQTFQDFEVIFLDDASGDDSIEILKEYSTHEKVSHFVVNEVNSGSPFSQWKKGIDLAQGEYIWIAESDDVADKRFLEALVGRMDPGYELGYCRSLKIDENGEKFNDNFWADNLDDTRWKSDYENSGRDEIKNYLSYRNTIPNASACVFRKKENLVTDTVMNSRYTGDWLFWVNYLAGSDVVFLSETLNYHRSHDNTTRKSREFHSRYMRLMERLNAIRTARKITNKGYIRFGEAIKYKYLIEMIVMLKNHPDKDQPVLTILPTELVLYTWLFELKGTLRSMRQSIQGKQLR